MNYKLCIIFSIVVFVPGNLFSMEYNNASFSLDPFTFLGLLLAPDYDNYENHETLDPERADIRNMWIGADVNWETARQKEVGLGIFLRGDTFAIITKYRSFYNKERQSGFFWGLYGLVEWRQMYWFYEKNSELSVGWTFPFWGHDNVYHSLGITGGFDIGFRFRKDNFGVTPYLGLGAPLFFCFGSLPPKKDREEFNFMNTAIRAIHIGLKFDFFQ